MIKFTKVIGLTLLLLQGCTFTQHDVALTANAPPIQNNVGKGTKVALRIFDDRETQTVGQRGAGKIGADISVSDLVTHLEREVKTGLESQGFEVLPDGASDADARLTVALRAFKFFIETGFWTGANNVEIMIKAEAERGEQAYLNTYRFDSETRSLVVPDGSKIDTALNAGLSDVLTQLMADKDLMTFLSEY